MNSVSLLCTWTDGAHIFSVSETQLFLEFASCVLANSGSFLPVCTFSLFHCSYIGELKRQQG